MSTIQTPVKQKTASEVVAEYELEGVIEPGELLDILEAIKTLKKDTGWGRIELFYQKSDLEDHCIYIKRKSAARRKKDV